MEELDEDTDGDGVEVELAPSSAVGAAVIKIAGELDYSNVGRLRSLVDQVLEDGPERIAFDLASLDFIDSSGLAVLLHAAASVTTVELRSPSAIVARVVDVTGLSDTFEIVT